MGSNALLQLQSSFAQTPRLAWLHPRGSGREGSEESPQLPAAPHGFHALGPSRGAGAWEGCWKVRFSQRPSPVPSLEPGVK